MFENPFTYGNPISNSARFFGRKQEVKQVFSRLCNAEAESSSIVGERRIGKTSLLQYLLQPAVKHEYGLDSDKDILLYNDMEMIGEKDTPTRIWHRLLRQIAQKCPDEQVKAQANELNQSDEIDNFALADLFSTILTQGFHIVFLFDEFEAITRNPNFTPDFFYSLRSLAIHYRLTLVTSSRKELIELTHSNEIRSSPFFNIFANINLRQFTKDEALELIEKSLGGTGVRFSEAEQKLVLQLAGTHPFFLQAAGYFLFAAYQENLDEPARKNYLRKKFAEEVSGQMFSYWEDSDDNEKIVLTALALLESQGRAGEQSFNLNRLQDLYNRSQQTISRLEKRSLLIEQSQGFTLFNHFSADWIIREISDTMRDQQGYDEWLNSNRSVMERLGKEGKQQMMEVLPKIAARYRDIMIEWASDPKSLVAIAALLKTALGVP